MDEQQMRATMSAVVSLTCQNLTNDELAALYLVATMNGDPHNRIFDYKKVKPLFTEANGTRMHDETKRALSAVLTRRGLD